MVEVCHCYALPILLRPYRGVYTMWIGGPFATFFLLQRLLLLHCASRRPLAGWIYVDIFETPRWVPPVSLFYVCSSDAR